MRRLIVGSAIFALVAATFSWTLADDHDTARKVAERLKHEQKEGNLCGFDINLEVAEGKVTLKGTVASAEQRKLAISTVREIDGVDQVVDALEIQAGQAPCSAATAATRTVALSETEASAQARPVSGSTESQASQDRRIGEDVARQLQKAKRDGQLKGFGVSVHVQNGYVWLKGRVGSSDQRTAVLEIVRRTAGVEQVIDELSVGESAANISQRLSAALQAASDQGILQGADLDVKVDGPDVWLTGTVSTPEQEAKAVDIARRVPGVRRVISGLETAGASQTLVPVPVPMVALLPSATSPLSRLDRPQSPPQAIARPAQMAALPQTQATRDVRFMRQVATASDEANEAVGNATASMSLAIASPEPAVGATRSYTVAQPALPMMAADQTPRPLGLPQMVSYGDAGIAAPVVAISQPIGAMPAQLPGPGQAVVPARYDHPSLPGYAWPTYAAYPNYGAVTYPKQYSPSAWPYIGPFYPYPQVPMGWRKVTLKWDDGWWNLDFKAK